MNTNNSMAQADLGQKLANDIYTTTDTIRHRAALIDEMYECNLPDEEAPSLSAVRERCYEARKTISVTPWSAEELADWYHHHR